MRKKKFFILLLVPLILLFTACKKEKNADSEKTKVGIAVIVAHPALDAIQQGIIDELKDQNLNVDFDLQNANGDMNTTVTIANKFAADKTDISIGIATPTAVALANAIKDKPVIFATVNDPVGVGLVDSLDRGKGNVTGLSDMIPIKEHMEIFHTIYPFKKLGFIYNGSESNSTGMAKTTKEVCESMGIEFVGVTINNSVEVKQAAESLIGRVDAFYVVTDNTLVAGLSALIDTAKKSNIPIFSEDFTSSQNGGVLYTIGFDYYKAGRKTGSIAAEIIKGKKPADIPVGLMSADESITLLNKDIAKALNIQIPDSLITKNTKIIENGELK